MEREFTFGDSVRGRNGKTMLVEDVFPPFFKFRFRCKWVDDTGEIQRQDFRREDLELVCSGE